MHCRERDTYEQHDYKYAQMHAVDMGVDTQDKLRYLWIYHPYTIQFILHTHVSECLSVCVSTHMDTHTQEGSWKNARRRNIRLPGGLLKTLL